MMKGEIAKQECLILIPARGGSKSISRKNMTLLGGKPLVEFTIRAAIAADLPGKICMSTDDEEIRSFGLSFPIEAPFLRPVEFARDDSGVIPVITHALDWYEEKNGFCPDFLVLLQPTCPFRTSRNIVKAYESMLVSGVNSLISVSPVREHPCEYIVPGETCFEFVLKPPKKPGRQSFPGVLFINGAIYMARTSYIRKTGKLFDEMAKLYFMETYESIDIDEPEDLEFANWLYEKTRSVNNNK